MSRAAGLREAALVCGLAACAPACHRSGARHQPERVDEGAPRPYRSLPLGVADCSERIGVIAGATGGIEAVQMDSGATIWSSAEATAVLTVDDARVVGYRPDSTADKQNRLHVVVLDARTGALGAVSPPIALPDWCRPFGDRWGAAGLTLHAVVRGDRVQVLWSASLDWSGGHPPSRDEAEQAHREGSGVFDVELTHGKVTTRWEKPGSVETRGDDPGACPGRGWKYERTDERAPTREKPYRHVHWIIARDRTGQERWRHRGADTDESPGPG